MDRDGFFLRSHTASRAGPRPWTMGERPRNHCVIGLAGRVQRSISEAPRGTEQRFQEVENDICVAQYVVLGFSSKAT